MTSGLLLVGEMTQPQMNISDATIVVMTHGFHTSIILQHDNCNSQWCMMQKKLLVYPLISA